MRAHQNRNRKGLVSQDHPGWDQLLADAVSTPGILSDAYQRFWNYSIGNQLLAMWQCMLRKIDPGPIDTFRGWAESGRHVKRGEKAITLCMPVKVRRRADRDAERAACDAVVVPAEPNERPFRAITIFVYKARWFVLSQTEGEDYHGLSMPDWHEASALKALSVNLAPFCHPNGNCQGYAKGREISVSPVAGLPHKTFFHELAHVVLGHTAEGSMIDDHDRTPINLREVEAEAVAFICCQSLGLGGSAESRGYIQHWLGQETISDRMAQKIFKAADMILKAGYCPAADQTS